MEQGDIRKEITVDNQVGELDRINQFFDEAGEEWNIDPILILNLNLVIEEAFTNILKYGYDDSDPHKIEIILEKTDGNILLSIIDDGHEWDPTKKDDPDVTAGVDEREIGGLGIFLIKKLMDSVEYRRTGNRNHLILTKKAD